MNKLLARWARLCQVAGEHGIPVLAGYSHPELNSREWDGLWIRHPSLGPAIALSAGLDLAGAVWVLAHELGHQFTLLPGALGARAHLTTSESQKRWGSGHLRQPDEEAANLWGAQELISDEEWRNVEEAHPASLKQMAADLDLPAGAALWRARAALQKQATSEPSPVPLEPKALALLSKPVTGQGGHQSFLRQLQRSLVDSTLHLTRKDFNRIREHLLNMGGGFRSRYQAVMDSAVAEIERAGGVRAFFRES